MCSHEKEGPVQSLRGDKERRVDRKTQLELGCDLEGGERRLGEELRADQEQLGEPS